MIKTKIPKSVLEILDKFIQINFRKYRYNSLADQLGLKTDTLIQRISRNKDYFDVDDSARPSRISIKKGIPEVYFYRDKNRCHACQKTVDPEKLSIKFRNPSRYEKNEWKNVISVCNDCKDKEILKRVKKTKPLGTTEYKEIIIMRSHQRNPETDKYENFYEAL